MALVLEESVVPTVEESLSQESMISEVKAAVSTASSEVTTLVTTATKSVVLTVDSLPEPTQPSSFPTTTEGLEYPINVLKVPVSTASTASVEVPVPPSTIADLLAARVDTSPFKCMIPRP